MLQHSKYVVVEVSTTQSTMTLVEYLITHGFDKFTIVSDLFDHPSLKNKNSSGAATPGSGGGGGTPTTTTPHTNGKPKASINDIASALSKKSSPTQRSNGFSSNSNSTPSGHSALARILEEKAGRHAEQQQQQQQQLQQQQQQQQQQIENLKLILGQTTVDEENEAPEDHSKEIDEEQKTESSDSIDFGLGPSDEQVRASMIHLLNPVLGSAFGIQPTITEESPSRKRPNDDAPVTKKHRWMTNGELEESRFGRGKSYGRVHCKATYKCALCGKPTTLNSTGSRWNLLRHVIMIHSESKPYQCFDCDFIGIKSNVVSHARQQGHRCDDALDVTTDEMRNEWNQMLHSCFPDYVKAKSRGWQPDTEVKEGTPETAEEKETEPEAVHA